MYISVSEAFSKHGGGKLKQFYAEQCRKYDISRRSMASVRDISTPMNVYENVQEIRLTLAHRHYCLDNKVRNTVYMK